MQRRGGGGCCCNTDRGLAFQGLFKPPRRGLWLRLPLLIQGGEPSCQVSRQKLARTIVNHRDVSFILQQG